MLGKQTNSGKKLCYMAAFLKAIIPIGIMVYLTKNLLVTLDWQYK